MLPTTTTKCHEKRNSPTLEPFATFVTLVGHRIQATFTIYTPNIKLKFPSENDVLANQTNTGLKRMN
jgi:hypothetical protein